MTTACFLSAIANKKRRTGKISVAFPRDVQIFGRLDTGMRASFTGSRPPPPLTSVILLSLVLHDL